MLSFGPTGHQAIIRDLTNAALGLHQAAGLTLPPPYGAGKRLNVTRKLCVSNATAARLRETIRTQKSSAVADQRVASGIPIQLRKSTTDVPNFMKAAASTFLEAAKTTYPIAAASMNVSKLIRKNQKGFKELQESARTAMQQALQSTAAKESLPTDEESFKAALKASANIGPLHNVYSAPSYTPSQNVLDKRAGIVRSMGPTRKNSAATNRNRTRKAVFNFVRGEAGVNMDVEQYAKNIGAIVDNEGRAVPNPPQFMTSPDDESLFARPQLSNRNRQTKSSSNASSKLAKLRTILNTTPPEASPPPQSKPLQPIAAAPTTIPAKGIAANLERAIRGEQNVGPRAYNLPEIQRRAAEQRAALPAASTPSTVISKLDELRRIQETNTLEEGETEMQRNTLEEGETELQRNIKRSAVLAQAQKALKAEMATLTPAQLAKYKARNAKRVAALSSTQQPSSSQLVSFSPQQSRR